MCENQIEQHNHVFVEQYSYYLLLPLTEHYHPQWSPDGKYLAFLRVRGTEDTENQVWTLDLRGGEAVQFTHVLQGVNSFRWSPDGTKMALVIKDAKPLTNASDKNSANEKLEPFVIDRLQFKKDYVGYLDRRRTHIYIKNGHEKPLQVTFGDYDDSDPQWNPDNKTIAIVFPSGDQDGLVSGPVFTVSFFSSLFSLSELSISQISLLLFASGSPSRLDTKAIVLLSGFH